MQTSPWLVQNIYLFVRMDNYMLTGMIFSLFSKSAKTYRVIHMIFHPPSKFGWVTAPSPSLNTTGLINLFRSNKKFLTLLTNFIFLNLAQLFYRFFGKALYILDRIRKFLQVKVTLVLQMVSC
jgi:hypothetical protein